MARLPQAQSKPDSDMLGSEQVTYLPGPDDPPSVKWRGHVFHANVPKTVTNSALIEQARGNRAFHVGPFDPSIHVRSDEPTPPKTAEGYRAWAVGWLKKVESVDDLCERWANEGKLRESLEVGWDDFHYLSSLFQPKLDELLRREDEPRKKRDELVQRNDLAELELQIYGVGVPA